MQLNICELNENDVECTEKNELMESSFEQIPENIVSIKKKVTKSILKPQIQKPIQNQIQKPKISYEDILSKMGMFVSDGKLHLVDRNTVSFQEEQKQEQVINQIPQNSYIHNKYFKNELQPQNTITRPKTAQEYKKMILENYIERLRIKQIKSKKLLMPTSNINMATGNSSNLNRLFKFK
jgi:hypothetical protein